MDPPRRALPGDSRRLAPQLKNTSAQKLEPPGLTQRLFPVSSRGGENQWLPARRGVRPKLHGLLGLFLSALFLRALLLGALLLRRLLGCLLLRSPFLLGHSHSSIKKFW